MRTIILIIACLLLVIPCKAEPNCTEEISGDVSGDCKVNFIDFSITALDWLEAGTLEPNITQEWVRRYIWNDIKAHAIAIDSSDNIYVTGGDATIKYDPNGNELWVEKYGGTEMDAIALDNSGNVYVTGMDGSYWGDYITIKYDPNGNSLWVATYGERGVTDCARAIAIDSASNIYVTGERGVLPGDYATVKYSPDGNELWELRYNGPGNGIDWAKAITIDSSDNIYVTGLSWGSDTSHDYATIKYTPDGNELWVRRYGGGGNQFAYAIAVDSAENILVTGGVSKYATIKYDPNGNELWVANYNGPGNDDDRAYAIIIDSNDNIYVTGESAGLGTETDYATIKYDPEGNELWVARYNGLGNDVDWAKAITVDDSGNVYVTGHSWGSGTSGDYTTIKYDSNGNEIWVERYDGKLGNGYDGANAIAIDKSDNVYVTGESNGSSTSDDDYVTIKYGPYYSCTPELAGDTNNDCKVDIFDLAEITSHWLECNLDLQEACWE